MGVYLQDAKGVIVVAMLMMICLLIAVPAKGQTDFTTRTPPRKLPENKTNRVDKSDIDNIPTTVDIKYTKDDDLKPGQYLEPVIFEPMKKSRSTYKVSSFVDFRPYYRTYKAYGWYLQQFK